MESLITTASAYIRAGLSAIPTASDKRPSCAWRPFTSRMMSDREIETFFVRAEGIGIVCGKVSGNLELLDFDDAGSRFEPWLAKIPRYLQDRLVVERSPSGGKHVYYRVEGVDVPGNRKLALKADGHVLIETRGEGGYVKCAPSTGYVLERGRLEAVQSVSAFEQGILIDAAKELDEAGGTKTQHVENRPAPTSPKQSIPSIFLPPWEDYVRRGDFTELMTRHGWKRTGVSGANELWERPGKSGKSTSATWNGEVLYVFSSNAAPFEPNKGYGKFQTYALLECGGDTKEAARRLRAAGFGGTTVNSPSTSESTSLGNEPDPLSFTSENMEGPSGEMKDPGPLPDELLNVPGFVDLLADHTLRTAPYPNRPLAFAGALAMLSHLSGRNFRDVRNLRTNIYLLALADSGVGKDYPRKVNMNLAAEIGVMPTMADRFASAEGLEDALLLHPASFFQVDEVDTLFAALQEKKDSAMEKIYGALLQFATSSDTTYAMRKKAIQQTGGKAGKFDKIRARGIREPHLTLLGCAIPKYLYSALSERALENGLLSRCLIFEAGARGKAGNPHWEPFPLELLAMARDLVARGGFEGLDLDKLENDSQPPYVEPYTVMETPEASKAYHMVTEACESLYDRAKSTAEKALWTRGAEKAARLALLRSISENPRGPIIDTGAVDWAWKVVRHLTERMLYQATVFVHDNEFDALRQKAMRLLRDNNGSMSHGMLLRYMHVDADTLRRIVETLSQSELIGITQLQKGGVRYTLA